MEKVRQCLENILKLSIAKYKSNASLEQEYEELEQVPPAPGHPGEQHDAMIKQKLCKLACKNKKKNRYGNLYPFDKHIFRFEDLKRYINASWIDFNEGNRFLITMGPIDRISYRNPDAVQDTCGDFWEMCWQSRGRVIVMLCSVGPEFSGCSQYYPDSHSERTYDSITVTHVSDQEDSTGSFVERKFIMTKNDDTREIFHQHFLSWPNYGVPKSDELYKFLIHVRRRSAEINADLSKDSPYLIIHCSGGVGRSGAFLTSFVACAKLIELKERIKNDESDFPSYGDAINLKDLVWLMRTQRHPWMVEGLHQYKLIYEVFIKQLNALIEEDKV